MAKGGWHTARETDNRIEQRELRLQNARTIATDDELVAQFLERRGATHCPPGHADTQLQMAMRWSKRSRGR